LSASNLIVVATLTVAIALTAWVRVLALNREWMDVPNARSSHVVPVPRGGGIAIVVASLAAFFCLSALGLMEVRLLAALAGGGAAIALVGFIDDHRPLRARNRLIVHFAAAVWALVWLGGVPPLRVGTEIVDLGALGHVLGVVAIVWTLNLYNFMVGIAGLAAGEATLIASGGAWFASQLGGAGVSVAFAAFAAASAGFLVWNWPPAKIFMGDVGSGYVGYVLAVLALAAMWHSSVAVFVWLLLGGLFFTDATLTLVRRFMRGDRVSEAHRSHAYQRMALRMGHLAVSASAIAINVVVLLPTAICALYRPDLAAIVTLGVLAVLSAIMFVAGAGRAD
jgi:Fuc2NAc and GlcNAc transferase